MIEPAAAVSSKGSDCSAVAGERVEHELKCWPKLFDPISRGEKRHDLRRATDRCFRIGDRLLLREFDPDAQSYTGRTQRVAVTYVTSADEPCALSAQALHPDFCILSIVPVLDA